MKKIIIISYHVISIILLILLPFIVNYPYGFICYIPVLSILVIVDVITYLNHIQKYPLNEYEAYKFNLLQDSFTNFDSSNNIYYIIIESKKGIYETSSGDKILTFDMNNCIFPKNYIRSYFVRNIHFPIINKRKLSIRKLSTSLQVDENFKYQNLKIVFIKNCKRKEYWIVKNGITKLNLIIADIIGNPFTAMILTNVRHGIYDKHKKISEKYYVENKKFYK